MATVDLRDQAGKKAGSRELPTELFEAPINIGLMHQVVVAGLAAIRRGTHSTKTRAEVAGGGRKPWRQKGTGRARHGSIRSPIWRHGGVTHGPRNEKDYSQKINRKMRIKALFTVLSKKYADGEVLFIFDVSLKTPKTKDARAMLDTFGGINGYAMLAKRRKNALYMILPKSDANVKKSFQNMGNVLVGTVSTL